MFFADGQFSTLWVRGLLSLPVRNVRNFLCVPLSTVKAKRPAHPCDRSASDYLTRRLWEWSAHDENKASARVPFANLETAV